MEIFVKATPNAKKDEIVKEIDIFGGILYKIKTTKPPEDGKANASVVEILANYFDVSKSKIKIKKGETSRLKVFEINV